MLPAQIQEGKMIRCALVHDHVLLREGLRRLLEDEPDIAVVAEAGNAAEALRKISDHCPEVVIADAHIFECEAAQTERLIQQESPNSKVLFLTTHESEGVTWEAPASRASYTVRQTSANELVEMVKGVAAGTMRRESVLTEWPSEELLSRKRALTTRERQVLKLLAEGQTVRSTASILGLSIKTVDAHKFNLMRKLGLHNKAELVMWAIQKKIVRLPANF